MKRASVQAPTDDEEAAIQRGIALDEDNPEREAEWFARARPAAEVIPPETYAALVRRRGPGKRPAKVPLTLKLAPDLVEALRSTGPGWQVRAGEALAAFAAGPQKPR